MCSRQMVLDYRHVDVRPLYFAHLLWLDRTQNAAFCTKSSARHQSLLHYSCPRSGELIFTPNLCVEVYLHEKEGLGATNVTDTW
jgi:hypothetical protein